MHLVAVKIIKHHTKAHILSFACKSRRSGQMRPRSRSVLAEARLSPVTGPGLSSLSQSPALPLASLMLKPTSVATLQLELWF